MPGVPVVTTPNRNRRQCRHRSVLFSYKQDFFHQEGRVSVNTNEAGFRILPVDASGVKRFHHAVPSSHDPAVIGLAHGIASSPIWSLMPGATLFVRPTPPLIAVVGHFDDASEARLEALSFQAQFALRTLRYVDFSRAEEDCRILASLLKERFGEEKLKQCYFSAMPRGGYLILGLLAYILGVHPSRLDSPAPRDATLIVLDDCAISGARFQDFLMRSENERIIFAPLYSHPELRESIETREHRVVACISAHDLADYSGETRGGKDAYRELWRTRHPDNRYWIGLPEYICFAWNEPDRPFWNHVSGKTECGWTLIPHECCLKNGPPRIPVYVQPEAKGLIRPSDHVIYLMDGDSVVIGDLDSNASYHLGGVGAGIWNEIIESGDREAAMKKIREKYGADDKTVRENVTAFLEDLIGRGILEETCMDSSV